MNIFIGRFCDVTIKIIFFQGVDLTKSIVIPFVISYIVNHSKNRRTVSNRLRPASAFKDFKLSSVRFRP